MSTKSRIETMQSRLDDLIRKQQEATLRLGDVEAELVTATDPERVFVLRGAKDVQRIERIPLLKAEVEKLQSEINALQRDAARMV
jgi:hypothetical protein